MKSKFSVILGIIIIFSLLCQTSMTVFSAQSRAVTRFKAIAAGQKHTAAVRENGTVVVWGGNEAGQCNVPDGLANVKAVAVGALHTLALKEDGTVVAWGKNDEGQCNIPEGLRNVKAISAGSVHNVALKEDGTVVAWGGNYFGQCNVPAGLSNVKAVTAGWQYTVAVKEDGTVVAWGANYYNQCDVPANLTNVKEVAASWLYVIALKEDGTVTVWGNNDCGQCDIPAGLSNVKGVAAPSYFVAALKNDGTVVTWGFDNDIPDGITNIKTISANSLNLLALREDDTVVAWGDNCWGQGLPSTDLTATKAISAGTSHIVKLNENGTIAAWGGYNLRGECNVPSGLTDVKDIAAGESHTVALKADGTVVAWGNNDNGQCNVPADLSGVKDVAAGTMHTVALKADGTVVAWGNNWGGQCTVPNGLKNVKAIAAKGYFTAALKEDGTVVAWGENYDRQCNVPDGLTHVKAIECGQNHMLAVKEDGTVVAWGSLPSVPDGLTNVKAVAAGQTHSVALKEDGTVIAWGSSGYYGECSIPPELKGAKAVAAYAGETVIVTEKNTIIGIGISPFLLPDIDYEDTVTPSPTATTSPLISRGCLDNPASNKTISSITKVSGWYLDPEGVARIEVLVDGVLAGTAVYGDSRPDVRSVFPAYNNSNAGFHYNLDTTKLTNGTHTLTIRETSSTGKQNTLRPVTVQVNNPLIARGCLDNPVSNKTISSVTKVSGWYLDPEGVAKVEVLVDGVLAGTSVYGDSRPDVGNVYPAYNNSNAGFHYNLDTTKLTNGTHTISIRETGSTGSQHTLGPVSVQVNNPLIARGCLDSPAPNKTISSATKVSGWYLDPEGVARIEVLVDGILAGTAVYGDSRPDVGNVYPAYNNSNAGFHYNLDTTKLTNGTHTVSIRETGNTGRQNALGQVTVTVSNINTV